MRRHLSLAFAVTLWAIDAGQLAQAFPFSLLQQGTQIEMRRDVRQLLPGRKANLVGYWRFEGGYADASGNGNTGIAHGSAALVTGGAFGQAVSLNGSTDYISFASSILPSATNVTISLWFNQDALASGKSFYEWGPKSGCSPSGQSFGSDNSGHIQASLGCGGTVTSATTFTVGTWNHAVMTKDGSSNVRLYLNGTLAAGPSNNNGGQTLASGNDLIGANWSGGAVAGYFNGKIDEVAVWNTVLSPAEVATLYQKSNYVAAVLADNPAAYWRFEEASGTSAVDASGNGNTATYTNSPTLQATGPLSEADYGITLDSASSQYVQTPYLQNAVTAYSIETWVKIAPGLSGVLVNDRGSSSGRSLTLRTFTDGRVDFGLDSGGILIRRTGVGPVNDNKWHHVVGTWQAPNGTTIISSQFNIYIDGVPVTINDTQDRCDPANCTSPLTGLSGTRIGYHAPWTTYLKGSVDEVALYTTELSAAQVAAHYKASGANGHCSAGTGYTATVIGGKCRWTFNQSTGSFSWTAPVANVHIFAVGGGGGGAGAGGAACCYNGGGGGGYYTYGNYTLTVGTSYTIVVGSGGAGGGSGGVRSLGSTGGSSGVTAVVTANGGLGGGTTNGGIRNGGAGGSGGGCGAFNGGTGAGGAGGSDGFCNNSSVIAGAGSAVTPFIAGYGSGGGGGGDSAAAGHTGQPGGANAGAGGEVNGSGSSATAFYGGGGGGAGCAGGTGGDGGSGIVIIDER